MSGFMKKLRSASAVSQVRRLVVAMVDAAQEEPARLSWFLAALTLGITTDHQIQGASTATKDPALKSKKDELQQEPTPLEKMLQNAGPVRVDGTDKFFGLENVCCNHALPSCFLSVYGVLIRCFLSLATHGTKLAPLPSQSSTTSSVR